MPGKQEDGEEQRSGDEAANILVMSQQWFAVDSRRYRFRRYLNGLCARHCVVYVTSLCVGQVQIY